MYLNSFARLPEQSQVMLGFSNIQKSSQQCQMQQNDFQQIELDFRFRNVVEIQHYKASFDNRALMTIFYDLALFRIMIYIEVRRCLNNTNYNNTVVQYVHDQGNQIASFHIDSVINFFDTFYLSILSFYAFFF